LRTKREKKRKGEEPVQKQGRRDSQKRGGRKERDLGTMGERIRKTELAGGEKWSNKSGGWEQGGEQKLKIAMGGGDKLWTSRIG